MLTQAAISTQVQEPLISGETYAESQTRYEEKAAKKEAHSEQLVVTGFAVSMNVDKGALLIRAGKETRTLYRGVHGVSAIMLLTQKGNLSIDALNWCQSQEMTVSIIDFDGSLRQYLTCEQAANTKLRRAQYTSDPAKVAYQLLLKKALEQYSLLQSRTITKGKWAGVSDQERACSIFADSLKWLELPGLPRWQDIDYMRTFEGRLSKAYWYCFEGVELKWTKGDAKSLPPHWKKAGTRGSVLSKNHGARHATSPFHALLNYAYAVLESQVRQALVKAGFDLSCGFLHADKIGRDSLVYDLMELYRSQIDAMVLSFVGKTTFRRGDFIPVQDGSVRVSPALAKYVVLSCSIDQAEIDKGANWLKQVVMGN